MKQPDVQKLVKWYQEYKRDLPWRRSRDPYSIWLSEVMLQQTTVAAVIPYYEKFLEKFPTLSHLAQAPLELVLEMWSGLGYYSRARNLHKAAQVLHQKGFAKTAAELAALPGFGPYTSRAVASIAFEEAVGVLDGNVIRVLSRKEGASLTWWTREGRQFLQDKVDQMCQLATPSTVNQALMELGATVCTPQKPLCAFCPWQSSCVAFQKNQVDVLPLKRPRKENISLLWKPQLHVRKNQIALIKNDYLPVLKGLWIFPGQVLKLKQKPKKFHFQHSITNHKIYVECNITPTPKNSVSSVRWVSVSEVKKFNPSSMLTKILQQAELI